MCIVWYIATVIVFEFGQILSIFIFAVTLFTVIVH